MELIIGTVAANEMALLQGTHISGQPHLDVEKLSELQLFLLFVKLVLLKSVTALRFEIGCQFDVDILHRVEMLGRV